MSDVSAEEFAAQLASDPAFVKRSAEREAERMVAERTWREAEAPIVGDLRRAGVQIDSVWDLVNTSSPYPAALPVLIEHLERGGYPDRVMESLGRALAVKPAVRYWGRLKAVYSGSDDPGTEEGTAVALAAAATKEQLDDLVGFLSLGDRGGSRIYFLRPIKRLGGEPARQLLESLRGDTIFGREVAALLGTDQRDR